MLSSRLGMVSSLLSQAMKNCIDETEEGGNGGEGQMGGLGWFHKPDLMFLNADCCMQLALRNKKGSFCDTRMQGGWHV